MQQNWITQLCLRAQQKMSRTLGLKPKETPPPPLLQPELVPLQSGAVLRIEIDPSYLETIKLNNWLAQEAGHVTSQGGEDGILWKILETIGIEPSLRWVVEFGACDGKRDSNSWSLIHEKQFSGVLIEPETEWFARLKTMHQERSDVYCFNYFVGWEGEHTLDRILARTPIPEDFGLCCIDIDGNDYHVWEAFNNYRPQVVCIEFHRLIHPSVHFVQPPDPHLSWPASLNAMVELGKRKGYELVCVINWNAMFVLKQHAELFHIHDNRPAQMFYPHEEMRLFQAYDGTLHLYGNNNHYWKYQRDSEGKITNIKISQHDIQALPDGLRIFQPRHRYQCKTLEAHAGQLNLHQCPSNRLLQYRANITSECGEDGIIAHILKVLRIDKGFIVDIGANDGKYLSHSWDLLQNKGWSGLLIEKDAECFTVLHDRYNDRVGITCIHCEVEAKGANTLDSLLKSAGVGRSFECLTIDVEGDDYHLWASLEQFNPKIVIVDFNPSISVDTFYVHPYQDISPCGASLRAMVALGLHKGYELAAVTDWNAIFVRNDLFAALKLSDNYPEKMYLPPFEMRMTQTLDGCMHLLTCRTLMRQDYEIAFNDFQVLPESMRGRDMSFHAFGALTSIFY